MRNKNKMALTNIEKEYFDRLKANNTALIQGTFMGKRVGIVTQIWEDENNNYNIYPIAILTNKDWLQKKLKLEGKSPTKNSTKK